MSCLKNIQDDLHSLGFDIEISNDSKVQINGYPADLVSIGSSTLLQNIVAACMNDTPDIEAERKEQMAREMAQASAISYGKTLSHDEMKELVDHLFACEMPNFSPSGKNIISILNLDEIEKRF